MLPSISSSINKRVYSSSSSSSSCPTLGKGRDAANGRRCPRRFHLSPMPSGHVDDGDVTCPLSRCTHETTVVDCQRSVAWAPMFSSISKKLLLGLFSLAKQKIKSVQDNFSTTAAEQLNSYAPYFSFDSSYPPSKQTEGYSRSFNDQFHRIRKARLDQISIETARLLLRLEQLTSTGDQVPKNGNTKERRSKFRRLFDGDEWISSRIWTRHRSVDRRKQSVSLSIVREELRFLSTKAPLPSRRLCHLQSMLTVSSLFNRSYVRQRTLDTWFLWNV